MAKLKYSGDIQAGGTLYGALLAIAGGLKSGTNILATISTTDVNAMQLYVQNVTNVAIVLQAGENGVANRDLRLNPNGGSVAVGADPGGTELLRVGGAIRAGLYLVTVGGATLGGASGSVNLRVSGDGTSDRFRLANAAAGGGIVLDSINAAETSYRPWYFQASAFVFGADPGGSEYIRSGGSMRLFDYLVVGGGLTVRGAHNYIGGAVDVAASTSVANNASIAIGDGSSFGLVVICENNGGKSALVTLNNGLHTTTIVSAVLGTWGTVAGGANNFNVYWDAGTSTYRVENKSGASTAFIVGRLGSFTTQ